MIEERPSCPECGDPLSVFFLKDRKTGKITIEFFCEGDGDDKFTFHIITGITNGDIAKLKEEGKTIKKEMGIKLVERRSEQEVMDSMDRDRQKANRLLS